MTRRRRGEGEPPDRGGAPADDASDPVSDRRGFFGLGAQRARDGGLRALKALTRAARTLQDAAEGLEPAPPPIRRAEPTTPSAPRAREAPPRAPRGVVRPPGALPEEAFLATCEACHRCVDACPEAAIFPAVGIGKAGRAGTPYLPMRTSACVLCADVPCAVACPTGALVPPSTRPRLGTAVVFRSICLNGVGDSCAICVDQCPELPSALRRGEDGFPVVDVDRCTGCGQCVIQCPTYPKALHITPA